MPEVSVIIPNYNHAPYLKQRIDSVLAQTYQDFEVIILDDLSPDNSREIIEDYRNHPKVSHVVFNDINSGSTFKQWEKGINLAKGDYIWIAESDDWCESVFLETLMIPLKANQNCTIAYSQSYNIYNNSEINWISKAKLLSEYVKGEEYIREYLLKNNSIYNASMVVFRKSIYHGLSNQYTTFKFCGDWVFWIEVARYGEVFISGKVLNYFRKHDKDVSGKAYSSGYNFVEELRVLKLLKHEGLITENIYKRALLYKYYGYKKLAKKFDRAMRKQVEQLFYIDGSQSYQSDLQKKYRLHNLKYKVKQLFKLF